MHGVQVGAMTMLFMFLPISMLAGVLMREIRVRVAAYVLWFVRHEYDDVRTVIESEAVIHTAEHFEAQMCFFQTPLTRSHPC